VYQQPKRKAERIARREGALRIRQAEMVLARNQEVDNSSESAGEMSDSSQNSSDSADVLHQMNEREEDIDRDHPQGQAAVIDPAAGGQRVAGEIAAGGEEAAGGQDSDEQSSAGDSPGESDSVTNSDNSSDNEENIDAGGNVVEDVHQLGDPHEYVRQQLLEWTLDGGVSMCKVDNLLKRLKVVHPNLPLSYKTLVQTPKTIEVVNCMNGEMWYFGITPHLQRLLSQEYFLSHNNVQIDVNIDSLPIFNNSKTNFIPILGRLVDCQEIFIAGIFCGDGSDPKDLHRFFEDYVQEVCELQSNGLMFENEMYNFKVRNYILDQKARASVKCVKGVRGYFCCEKCTVRGIDFMNRMCLLDHNCELRTDESFNELVAIFMTPKHEHYDDFDNVDEHIIGVSPLFGCEQQLVSKFRLDSMHLVYKGVFLRWLDFIWNGRGNYALSPYQKREISECLGSFRKWCPSDFNRKPFAISSVKMKATELRRILLYDGVVVFKILDNNLYRNYLLLHCGIYILCSPRFHKDLNDEANEFLRSFVNHAEEIFGAEFIVYNVHSLIHLASECLEHGTLDEFGAFPFENCLGWIKARITLRAKPLQQIAKREIERSQQPRKVKPQPRLLQMAHLNDPNEQVAGQQYKKIFIKRALLSINSADSYCEMLDGSIVNVTNIIDSENGPVIVGKKIL